MSKFVYDVIHQSSGSSGPWVCVSNSSKTAKGSGVVDLLALLNQVGEEGWEVCTTAPHDHRWIVLKKQVE